jgi:hypothetical protein
MRRNGAYERGIRGVRRIMGTCDRGIRGVAREYEGEKWGKRGKSGKMGTTGKRKIV